MSKADEEPGELLSIDLLIVTRELESVWDGRERVGWEHGELPVVSRSGLIGMKRLRGSGKVGWSFVFTAAVYNLVRLRNLTAEASV